MYVSITQLNQSDSGRYRCSLDRAWRLDPNDDFELIVTEASTTSTPNGTLRPFSASVFLSSASTPPTTQSLSSTSGSSTPSSASSGSSDVLIYVRLILVVVISIFLVTLLIFCMRKRTAKPRGPPVESERADITQDNQLCEEIREEDRQSSSPPAGVSSVYATPNASNQMEMKTIDLHSVSTSAQNKVHASAANHTTDASPPHLSKNISSNTADGPSVANR
ncbi:uncharacterized protein LOC134618361 [Pelmatolapia mariae]|uniref:uncharacterized protein LOC134618361 n=1 Tax=Pelmatolapia mariae TaxID=158779 RepID=UPI002FE6427B